MKLGVMSPVLNQMGLEEALAYLSSLGVDCLEIGAGGYPGKAHLDPKDYLDNPAKVEELKGLLKKYNIEIAAVSCHGNPIHPNKEIAARYHNEFVDAMKIAVMLGVDTIIGFSGCPGDCENSKNPNWVTCAWPEDYLEVLDWQWNQVLIPYWKETAKLAKEICIKRIAFELHPGFCVYNPETALRLREAVGPEIGVNFDPSHLIWQGIDPAYAIRVLGKAGAIFHFHAKDTKVDKYNTMLNGVLDTKPYGDEINRSWIFRSCGYVNDYAYWKDMVSNLVMTGYDHVLSIEHEDSLMTVEEGLDKAITFLKEVLTHEKLDKMWWA